MITGCTAGTQALPFGHLHPELRLIWAAVAVHQPEALACELGHKAVVEHMNAVGADQANYQPSLAAAGDVEATLAAFR